MQTISVALIVFQFLAEEDDKLRFLIALFVSSTFGVLVYCTIKIFILEGLQNGWNLNRFGDLLTSWFVESAASAVFGVGSRR